MKRTKILSALLMASMLFTTTAIISCADEDPEKTVTPPKDPDPDPQPETVSLENAAPGSLITVDGVEYYVIKNTYYFEAPNASVSARAGKGNDKANDTPACVEKFGGDDFAEKLLDRAGIKQYWLGLKKDDVVNVKIPNADSSTGTTALIYEFPVYKNSGNGNNKKIALYTQNWSSDHLIPTLFPEITDKSEQCVKMAELDVEEIRTKHDPQTFHVYQYDDAGKIIYQNEYEYNIVKDSETGFAKVDISDSNLKNYTSMPYYHDVNGKNQASLKKRYDADQSAQKMNIYLCNARSSTFYKFFKKDTEAIRSREITAYGDGVSSTMEGDWKNVVSLICNSNGFTIRNQLSGSKSTPVNYELVVNSNYLVSEKKLLNAMVDVKSNGTDLYKSGATKYTLAEAVALDYFKDNVKLEGETTLNGFTVPAKILLKANLAETDGKKSILDQDFLWVTFVPDTSKTTGIYYEEENLVEKTNEDIIGNDDLWPSFCEKYNTNYTAAVTGTYELFPVPSELPFVGILDFSTAENSVTEYGFTKDGFNSYIRNDVKNGLTDPAPKMPAGTSATGRWKYHSGRECIQSNDENDFIAIKVAAGKKLTVWGNGAGAATTTSQDQTVPVNRYISISKDDTEIVKEENLVWPYEQPGTPLAETDCVKLEVPVTEDGAYIIKVYKSCVLKITIE